jgi:electron transfer flavoprotein-quinone oxidoreductase
MGSKSNSTGNEYDVIVVGAGFGGPVAAKRCADAGLKTLVIERSEKVGEKVISGLTIPFHGFLFGPDFIRDSNPPIERPVDGIINYIIKDIDNEDIDIDDSLKVPRPFSPVFAFGYNAYCKPFCEWEMKKAKVAGAELRTSTTVVDVVKENGSISGIITETGEKIRCKIVINAEGSQGLLAIKAGVREKYPPETISLADIYDYEMSKADLDRMFGFTLRFCWGWDEQKIAPPLGHGNGLMVWPYRKSLHFMQDQCLRNDEGPVYNLKKSLKVYHDNITSKLPWWRDKIAPRIKLRARMWEGFEIYVGLDERLRNLPNVTDGMLLIGDVAGLENTELCDGVPTAWFSADIAADVAIEAVRSGDTSKSFLMRYSERINDHPIIQWAITSTNRYNLRYAQAEHDEKKLKKYIHNGWGLGAFTHSSTPLMKMALRCIKDDPDVIGKWVRMYLRYYYNWHHERFDGKEGTAVVTPIDRGKGSSRFLSVILKIMDRTLKILRPFIWLTAILLMPLADMANLFMRMALPVMEPIYLGFAKLLSPVGEKLGKRFVNAVINSDPAIFEAKTGME